MTANNELQPLSAPPSRLRLGVVGIGVVGILALAATGLFLSYRNQILPAVEVLGIAVGGQSRADARYTVNSQLQLGNINTVALQFEDQSWDVKLTDFGFRADANELVEAAFRVGRSGDPVADTLARLRAITKTPQAVPLETARKVVVET